jgi:hypothetical protein
MSFCILPQVSCSRESTERDDTEFINVSLREYWKTLTPQLGPSPYEAICADHEPLFYKLIEILKAFPAVLRAPIFLHTDCRVAAEAVRHVLGSEPDEVSEAKSATLTIYCNTAVARASPPKHKGSCILLLPNKDQYSRSTAAALYNFSATYEKTTLYSPVLRGDEEVALVGARCLYPLFSEKAEGDIPLFYFTRLSEALIILGQTGLEVARSEGPSTEEWKLKYYPSG